MPQQVKKSLIISIYFALTVSALLVFWQVRNFDFVNYDDDAYVYKNPYVLNGLTPAGVIWAFTTDTSSHWHPLTWLSLMLDCQLFGPGPAGFHLTNLFFHIVNTLLLFLVLKQMTNAIWQSAFVAALFALHPMHVESVAWIVGRKDVLSALFWFLTMGAYFAYIRRPGAFRYTVTLVLFALGLMAKPMLVTLPFVLLLFDYWPLDRFAASRIVKTAGDKSHKPAPIHDGRAVLYRIIIEKIPFFALVAVSSIVTFMMMRSGGRVMNMDMLPLNSRIVNAVLSYVRYLYKMVWPQNLAAFYPFDIGEFPFWQVAACVLLLLVISIFVISFGRKQKYLPVGWFWFVGTLVPVIGFVQVGLQAYADRYTYIPYIGLFVMLTWGLPQLLSKWISASPQRKIALGLSMILILTTLGICTHRQTSYWKNSITLFSHVLEVTENNYVAYNNRSVAYGDLGCWSQAVEDVSQAVRINPNYARGHYNLGLAYANLGRLPEAIEAYKQAVRLKPNYILAYNNLGVTYGNLDRLPEAIEAFKQVIKIKPDSAEAHYNLGNAYLAIGDKNSALAEYNILKSLESEFANKLLKKINK
jgi:hypothetical protein